MLKHAAVNCVALLMLSSCGPSDAECERQRDDVVDAKSAFPAVWAECVADSDCTSAPTVVCATGCNVYPVAKAHAADLEAFMASDPDVAATCETFNKSGCEDRQPMLFCPATSLACTSGRCQPASPSY